MQLFPGEEQKENAQDSRNKALTVGGKRQLEGENFLKRDIFDQRKRYSDRFLGGSLSRVPIGISRYFSG